MAAKKLEPFDLPDFSDFKIACRLNEIMEKRGVSSLREAYRLTGVHWNVLGRITKGETKGIEFDTIMRICLGLRCTPNELFEIDAVNDENAPTDA